MTEMTPGAKAAWERWASEPIPTEWPVETVSESSVFLMEQAYAAGFEAALAAIERYEVHVTERITQAEAEGDEALFRAMHVAAQNARTVRNWVLLGITCGVAEHQRCQEAKTR